MCDTFVWPATSSPDGATWFGKNSDREPGEEQIVERHGPRPVRGGAHLCTHISVEDKHPAGATYAVLLSRPTWMWGAEMGANEHGLVIGNEAVFTRVPVAKTGLTGMDLLRLALERARTAAEAIDVITTLLREHGQGGVAGFRNKAMRYHNAFVAADAKEAWILETAGPHWAARRATGPTAISNALTIGQDFDRLSDSALTFARENNLCSGHADFNFAKVFGAPSYRYLAGAESRQACTREPLMVVEPSSPNLLKTAMAALRSHGGGHPADGMRMTMTCAHASFWPTRSAGQTAGSMISRLSNDGAEHWLTGTSSPCLSIFKPVDCVPIHGRAGAISKTLFWRHEQLHRAVLAAYEERRSVIAADLSTFQDQALQTKREAWAALWEEHDTRIDGWRRRTLKIPHEPYSHWAFRGYWRFQGIRDGLLRR